MWLRGSSVGTDLSDGMVANGQAAQQQPPPSLPPLYNGKGLSISGALTNQAGNFGIFSISRCTSSSTDLKATHPAICMAHTLSQPNFEAQDVIFIPDIMLLELAQCWAPGYDDQLIYLLAAYQMAFQNSTGSGLDGFMIQFNNNALGVLPASQHIPVQLPPGGSSPVIIPLQRSQNMVSSAAGRTLQVS